MENNKTSYYGSEKRELLSYLEFGSIDLENAKKTIWGYWQDQEAYDLYMFARYARDLFLFRDFFDEKEKSIVLLNEYIKKSAHDKIIDYIFKYAGVMTLIDNEKSDNRRNVCESGSSLFGLIEEIISVDYVLSNGKNIDKIKALTYLGSDISDMMNRGAKELHPEFRFKFSTADTVSKLMDEFNQIGMFYGLSVSLRYALREAKDLLKVANNSEIVVLNRISLSFNGNEQIKAGTGKYAYLLSADELKALFRENGVFAKYTTQNRQINKDGNNTVRVSMVISRNKDMVNDFTDKYNQYIANVAAVMNFEMGKWLDIDELNPQN